MHSLSAFVVLTVMLTLSPGPDDVLVLRCAARGGPRSGSAAAVGAATGSLLWGAAAATGLAALLAGSPGAFRVVRLAGAAYLIVLGLGALLASRPARRTASGAHRAGPGAHRAVPPDHRRTRRSGPRPTDPGRAFAAGLASDLLNPKIGVFYLAVVPSFLPPGAPVLGYSLLLCAIDVTVATAWLVLLARLADRLLAWLRRPLVEMWVQRLLNASLVGIGAVVALGP